MSVVLRKLLLYHVNIGLSMVSLLIVMTIEEVVVELLLLLRLYGDRKIPLENVYLFYLY